MFTAERKRGLVERVDAVRLAVAALGADGEQAAELLYRSDELQLWQQTPAADIQPRIPGLAPFNHDTNWLAGYGPTHRYWSKIHGARWHRPGGDWFDRDGVLHGDNHWATIATNSGHGKSYSVDVTDAVRALLSRGTPNAWRLSTTTALRSLSGKNSQNPPTMLVRYTSATDVEVVLSCTNTFNISEKSLLPDGWNAVVQASPLLLEFERPAEDVVSASVQFTVVTQWSGTGPLVIDPITVPRKSDIDASPGIASRYGLFDDGLASDPSIIFAQRFADDEPRDAFIDDAAQYGERDTFFSPEFWGGPVDKSKLPYSGYGKWINGKASGGNLEIRRSTDGEPGYRPIVPGFGSLHTVCKAGYDAVTSGPIVDGSNVGNSGTTGSAARLFMPPEHCGTLRHGRIRCAVMFSGDPLTPADRLGLYRSWTKKEDAAWEDWAGKGGPCFSHDDSYGGVSGSAGGPFGWTFRYTLARIIAGMPGPDDNKIAMGWHLHDFQNNAPAGHRYGGIDTIDTGWGQIGGHGSAFELWRHYWIEIELKLNTANADGSFIPDGFVKVWVDDRLAYEQQHLVVNTLPPYYDPARGTPPQATANSMFGNGGFRDVLLNFFHGGKTQLHKDWGLDVSFLAVSAGGEKIGIPRGIVLN